MPGGPEEPMPQGPCKLHESMRYFTISPKRWHPLVRFTSRPTGQSSRRPEDLQMATRYLSNKTRAANKTSLTNKTWIRPVHAESHATTSLRVLIKVPFSTWTDSFRYKLK